MHDQGIIRGDLKGVRFCIHGHPPARSLFSPQADILVNDSGHACLADFGLSMIISDQSTPSFIAAGTVRWMSPERLDPDQFGFGDGRPTKESDCYALGMVIYEVLSGQAPFTQFHNLIVMQKVIEGLRPGRPRGVQGAWFTDGLWRMLELCWKPKPNDRPSLDTILQCLQDVPRPSRLSSPSATDVDVETNGDQPDVSPSNSGMSPLLRLGSQVRSQPSLLYNSYVECTPSNDNGLQYARLPHLHP